MTLRSGIAAASVVLALAITIATARTARAEDHDGHDTEAPATSARAKAPDAVALDFSAFLIGGSMTPPPTLSSFHTPDTHTYPGLAGVSSTVAGGPESLHPAGGIDLHVGLHSTGRFGVDLPILGFRYVFLGGTTTALSDGAGNHATLDLNMASGAFSFFGVGAHAQWGPLLLRAAVRPVLEWSSGSGTVTQGFVSSDVSSYPSFAVGFDADLQACGMVAESSIGVCATVSPRMWRTIDGEGGANNGVFFGLGIVYWDSPRSHDH